MLTRHVSFLDMQIVPVGIVILISISNTKMSSCMNNNIRMNSGMES